ncbi:toxin-antitoxin system HicB family antitoxin [Nostoc sphaeroides]|nr:toxin-antitoxin system HicB family antitoxin [Nostoc sphaeroides]MCC5630178.1 type II toxin-antitoxin system HicB family antitoxin [Nostoc sphaeroides CHAB 2801]
MDFCEKLARLAIEAAEQNVSLNRYVSLKLAC